MLEGLIGMIGGPAGVGFLIGTVALAAEKYLPMLAKHFDLMGTQSEEGLKKAHKALDDLAEKYRKTVEQMEKKPLPGTEHIETEKKSQLAEMFNVKSMKGIETALLTAGLKGEVSDMTREEIEEQSKAKKDAAKAAFDVHHEEEEEKTGGGLGADTLKSMKKSQEAANDKVGAIEQRVASRTRDRLLAQASNPDTPEGIAALKQLQNLAKQHPEHFPPDFTGRIDAILNASKNAEFFKHIPENQFTPQTPEQKQLGLEIDEAELAKGPAKRSRRELLETRIARERDGIEPEAKPHYNPRHPRKQLRDTSGARTEDQARTMRHDAPHDKQPRYASKEGMEQAEILKMINAGQKNLDSTLALAGKSSGAIETLRETVERQRIWLQILHAQLKELQGGANGVLNNLKNFQQQGGF